MPGTARRLRITCGVAESPIRNAASIVPAISALAASSPPRSSSTVGCASISLAFSIFSASTRAPLPSGPIAIRLPRELRVSDLDRLGAAAIDHQRLGEHAAQRDQLVVPLDALGEAPLHEADVHLDRRVRELLAGCRARPSTAAPPPSRRPGPGSPCTSRPACGSCCRPARSPSRMVVGGAKRIAFTTAQPATPARTAGGGPPPGGRAMTPGDPAFEAPALRGFHAGYSFRGQRSDPASPWRRRRQSSLRPRRSRSARRSPTCRRGGRRRWCR